MATQTELVQALTTDMTILKERVDSLRGETEPLREITSQLAVIEHKVSELQKTKDLWGQRGWMVLTIALSAIFSFMSALAGVLLTAYLRSKNP